MAKAKEQNSFKAMAFNSSVGRSFSRKKRRRLKAYWQIGMMFVAAITFTLLFLSYRYDLMNFHEGDQIVVPLGASPQKKSTVDYDEPYGQNLLVRPREGNLLRDRPEDVTRE